MQKIFTNDKLNLYFYFNLQIDTYKDDQFNKRQN